MFAIDDPTAVAVMPAPEGAGTPGFWTEGNPAIGQAATYVRASFLNMLQSELLNILTAAGVAPSKTTYDQLLTSFRSNALVTATDTGPTNACAIAYTPAITALTDGMVLWFKAAAANTGATTLSVNAVGAKNVVGGAHTPLQGGEIVANGKCMVVWNAAIPAFVLIECTGGALQVSPGTRSGHAAQMSQLPAVVGSTRNLRAYSAGGKTVTFTADEIIVETGLGGTRYCIANFNKVIDLAKVGAGGMDVGVANNGFTAVYAIYNPVANVWDTLAVDTSAVVAPQVYGGTKMPAGFTASALISVVGTQTASGFSPFSQMDRTIDSVQVLSQSTNASTGTPIPWAVNTIPKNAIECKGSVGYSCSVTSQGGTSVFGNAAAAGPAGTNLVVNSGSTVIIPFSGIVMTTPQTLWYTGTTGGGTPTYQVFVSGYKF